MGQEPAALPPHKKGFLFEGALVGSLDRTTLSIAVFVLLGLNFLLQFPGETSDLEVYRQVLSGDVTDWVPAVMTRLWMALHQMVEGPAPMFAIQVLLHWAGFALIADGLHRSGYRKLSFLLVLSGATPFFLFYTGQVYKDVLLASSLITFFGIIFWFRALARPIPVPVLVLALILWLFGTLLRANAVFASAPLLVFALPQAPRLRWPSWTLIIALLIPITVPLSIIANRDLLGARDSGVAQSLQLFDLTGIAYHSGDASKLQAATGRLPESQSYCYTPLFWDSLREDRCQNLWQSLPPVGSSKREEITGLWIASIIEHPVAYAAHRLKHFNATTNFMVPPALHCYAAPEIHDCGVRSDGTMDQAVLRSVVRMDYIKKNALTWPIVWLLGGLTFAIWQWRLPATPALVASRALLASGLIYSLAYAVIGVAADPRYNYWTIMAVQTGVLLTLVEFGEWWRRRKGLYTIMLLVLAVVAVGYVFRFAGLDQLLAT